MEKKLLTLSKIAKKLNSKQITWALGASAMLYLNGIVEEFHDVDLMVTEKHIEKAMSLLSELGNLQERSPNPQYKTKYFLEYTIDEVDVDVMAGFVIVKDGKTYPMEFDESHIERTVTVNGEQIPLQSLADWHHYYQLMDRPQKAAMCQNKHHLRFNI